MPELQRYLDGRNYAAWSVTEESYRSPRDLVKWARLAPNSHNTQPWAFSVEDTSIVVSPDIERGLKISDPTQREMYISIGAAIANLKIAAHRFGFETGEEITRNSSNGLVIKRITLIPGHVPTQEDIDLFEAIPQRVSNRSAHQQREIPQEMKDVVLNLQSENIHSILVVDGEGKAQIGQLISEGDDVILNNPGFKGELASWLRSNNTTAYDGMPGFGFGLGDIESTMFPSVIVRSSSLASQVSGGDKKLITDQTAGIGIISTREDTPEGWLEAGEEFEQIALQATRLGLSVNVLAVLVETGEFYKDLQTLAGTEYRPQIMFRIGYPTTETQHAPRRPTRDTIEIGFGEERKPTSWQDKPRIFHLAQGEYELNDLKRELGEVTVLDRYDGYLVELFKLRNPAVDLGRVEGREALKTFVGERMSDFDGVWVYAPWRRELTHIPVKEEFFEILYSRNNPCIEPEAERAISELKISLAGLSVGSNIAMDLLQLGVQHLTIADFDSIELSNLSRMAVGGVFDVGERKTKILAQRMYEYNPFMDLTIFEGGINEANMQQMVDEADIFIDHMDSLPLKIKVRERAKQVDTIVVMATDIDKRPTFEVERPQDPMFHGRVTEEALEVLRKDPANFAQWASNAVQIFGLENTSAKVLENFMRVNRREQNYGSQLGLTGSVAAGILSYIIYEIARGNIDRLAPFRVVHIEQEDLVDRERDEEARERFKREFNIP